VAMRIAFLRQAIALGQHGRRIGEGNPTGAVVVKRGKVFAAAWDRVAITKDPTAHAEVLAIRRACKRLGSHELPDCELYISAEPCPMCIGAVHWAKPRVVYYVNAPLVGLPVEQPDVFSVDLEAATPLPVRAESKSLGSLLRPEKFGF
jgi:guanine deaminase